MSITLAYHRILHQENELEALINGCSRNERSAQNKVYELFYPKMKAMVSRYFPNEAEAEEVLNNGFLRVFKKIDQYAFKGSFEGWLRVIIKHSITDYARKYVTYRENTNLVEKEEFEYGKYVKKDAADRLQYKELLALVQSLPKVERIVFNMFVIDGMEHKEIAKKLKVREGTSRWYLFEARRILKEKIEQLENYYKED